MTKNQRRRDKAVMMSSVIPSVKYSCSGSRPRLVIGRMSGDQRVQSSGLLSDPLGSGMGAEYLRYSVEPDRMRDIAALQETRHPVCP